MTTEELHYEFKRRWDKNSNSHKRSWTDLEIDQVFNTASSDFVDLFGTGKNPKNYTIGFEVNQRMIDMVSTLVRSYPEEPLLAITSVGGGIYEGKFSNLQTPYRHYVSSLLQDSQCGLIDVNLEQHQDLSTIRLDYHRKANKKWKRVPAVIRNKKLYLYTDSLFNGIQGLQITYIKEPNPICLGTYTVSPTVANPNPTVLKAASSTDIDSNYHHVLVGMAVEEAARIYENQFQLVTQENKLNNL